MHLKTLAKLQLIRIFYVEEKNNQRRRNLDIPIHYFSGDTVCNGIQFDGYSFMDNGIWRLQDCNIHILETLNTHKGMWECGSSIKSAGTFRDNVNITFTPDIIGK